MNPLAIARTPSAHDAPLSIGQILATGVARSPSQEIVYSDRVRHTYATFAARVNRLASALGALGVEAGSTVAVMDWDSHRYLEAFFAVPSLGCVIQTVNIRLSPEQILYTLNHAQARLVDRLAEPSGGSLYWRILERRGANRVAVSATNGIDYL